MDLLLILLELGVGILEKKADSRMRIAAERRDINILSRARQITKKDFDEFNYILAMDDSNFRNIQDLKNRKASSGCASIKKIQDFRSVFNEQEVPDPYFGGDEGFDYVLDILEDSVKGFLESISWIYLISVSLGILSL